MKPNSLLASITLALAALGCLAAVIVQVVRGTEVDPILAGLTGSLLTGLLPSPVSPQATRRRRSRAA